MDLDIIQLTFQRLLSENLIEKHLTVSWHAGEPLIMSVSFYESAFQLIDKMTSKLGIKITHNIQTNGTLFTNEFCNLFKNYKVDIGISLDGPKFLHDSNRVYRNGNGSFDVIMKGINLLKEYQIPFHSICVLTENSLNYPNEILEYFEEIGVIMLGFNVEEIEGFNHQSFMVKSESLLSYTNFMKVIYDLTKVKKYSFKIREFKRVTREILYGKFLSGALNQPLTHLSITNDGYFSTFSPELVTNTHPNYGNFHFGNIKTDNIKSIYSNSKFNLINNEIQQGVKKCKETCEYFISCGGGAPSNKVHESGTFNTTVTNFCNFTEKVYAKIVFEDLESMIT
jgi:uncharacterized protein